MIVFGGIAGSGLQNDTWALTLDNVLNPPVPTVQVTGPASGQGSGGQFTYTFSHPNGWQNLNVVDVLFNNFLDGRHACYLAYVVPSSTLVLVNDAGDPGGPFAGIVTLGDSTPIRNSQCEARLVLASGSGNTLTLTLFVTFTPGFGGNRVTYLSARDQAGSNSNWQALGTWDVPWSPGGPIVMAGVTPGRGSGLRETAQSLTVRITDTKGAPDIGFVNVLINDFLDGRSACHFVYLSTNELLLVNDAGDAAGPFSRMMLDGSAAKVQNSQCTASAAGSSAVMAGNSLTLTLNLTFTSAFAGNRVVYVAGRDANGMNTTGWQAMGTWTVQ